MSSRANDQDTELPERPRPDEAEVYRYGRSYRWLAYGTGGLVVLVLASVGLVAVTSGLADVSWNAYAGATAGLMGVATSAPELLSELCLKEDGLRKDGPLRTETKVPFDEVRRVFIGGVSVEFYVDSDHDPALTFNRNVQDSDDLIEKLVGRLPASAQVDHPSGELSERLGDRLTAA